jgi:hypothetical protein
VRGVAGGADNISKRRWVNDLAFRLSWPRPDTHRPSVDDAERVIQAKDSVYGSRDIWLCGQEGIAVVVPVRDAIRVGKARQLP